MRVLYLSPTAALGGAERVLLSVLSALRDAGSPVQPHLLALADGPLLEHAARLGVAGTALPMPAGLAAVGDSQLTAGAGRRALLGQALRALPATARYLRRLRRHVAALAPDLVHSNGIKTHLLGRLAGLGARPVVWHVHDYYGSRPVVGRLLRWACRGVGCAVAVSESVAEDTRRALPGCPVEVIANAIDVDHFAPAPRDGAWLDARAGLPPAPPGTVRVGLVATYARWKGQDVFLEAAGRLLRTEPSAPVRFYVVGGPIYQTRDSQFSEAELRARADGHGLRGRVGFLGFLDDPAEAYRSLDIVAHASARPEPFGLTIVEAIACGRAVITTGAGGAAELFRHGHDAVGVPPGDAAALAEAVGQLAHDPGQRDRLGTNARRTACGRFGRERLGPQFLAVYQRLLPPTSQAESSPLALQGPTRERRRALPPAGHL
jgi:glycosyltransferase involved in cell wall biosynthesis